MLLYLRYSIKNLRASFKALWVPFLDIVFKQSLSAYSLPAENESNDILKNTLNITLIFSSSKTFYTHLLLIIIYKEHLTT